MKEKVMGFWKKHKTTIVLVVTDCLLITAGGVIGHIIGYVSGSIDMAEDLARKNDVLHF